MTATFSANIQVIRIGFKKAGYLLVLFLAQFHWNFFFPEISPE